MKYHVGLVTKFCRNFHFKIKFLWVMLQCTTWYTVMNLTRRKIKRGHCIPSCRTGEEVSASAAASEEEQLPRKMKVQLLQTAVQAAASNCSSSCCCRLQFQLLQRLPTAWNCISSCRCNGRTGSLEVQQTAVAAVVDVVQLF